MTSIKWPSRDQYDKAMPSTTRELCYQTDAALAYREATRRLREALVLALPKVSHAHNCSASRGSERDCHCLRDTINEVLRETERSGEC